jgi:indolepyruvate ferredoxin oxidoreductase
MTVQDISLADRFDLGASPVLLNGTQALVRLMLMQAARDRAAGLRTAGYVTGYRGSPLGAVDQQMVRAAGVLGPADIRFQPGLNEDLAATAIWGTQQAHLRGEGRVEGVFALWYGKGPGVDRSGDVMRHANMAGSAALGGVLMAMGDDHTGESSTTLHQSEGGMIAAGMPVLSPAGVQEILDFGLYGFALSRFSGLWVGLKTMKDTVESTAVVDGRPGRMAFTLPDFPMPEGGGAIRLIDTPQAQEARLHALKLPAALAFARANGIDRRVWGGAGARIGLMAAGKSWLDLQSALGLLGLDAEAVRALGITTRKVGQVWPLEPEGLREWAEGLEVILCVEEKRKLIEGQAKEILFNTRGGLRIIGGRDLAGEVLLPESYALDPVQIALAIARSLEAAGVRTEALAAARARLEAAMRADDATEIATRLPYFCAGCPHNSSTRVPEGSRAYAGIGCHYMVQWMDRETLGFTHMGGEGANWIGEAPFSTRGHVFQNMGDGTYNHSGVQAIRAAIAAGTTITYKILYNDAVAMTGGQGNDGGLTAARIAHELRGMGVRHLALVHDPKEGLDLAAFPQGIEVAERDALDAVQRRYATLPGVSVILYVQTCAAEKRRRRKRGAFADPDRRVFINTDVCEGCGDCGVQSNCVAIQPVETEFGRKRAIDQSACNKDFSCLSGFCPSFVTLEGARPRAAAPSDLSLPEMPGPALPPIRGTHNIVLTGVGGTGVVTVGAILAMAAHLEGRGVGMIEMAGLAQKGGAVHIHARIAERPEDIGAIRVSLAEADALIGGDLVVSAGARTLGLTAPGRTGAVVNSHEGVTGAFTRDPGFRLPGQGLRGALAARLGAGVAFVDATALARATLGDTIFANMVVFGAAWQRGLIPLGLAAIRRAVELNGAAVAGNLRAFEIGRWAALHPADAAALLAPAAAPEPAPAPDPEAALRMRERHLRDYGGEGLVRRFRTLVDRAPDPALRAAIARGYHKLLAVKDEYEVARLHLQTLDRARAEFEGDLRPTFHLAPPFLPGHDTAGRPKKRAFGPWVIVAFRALAALRGLRGGPLDPFRWSAERRMERALIARYEADMAEVIAAVTPDRRAAAVALADLPLEIRGFGPVKAANAEKAVARRAALLAAFRAGSGPRALAAE